MKNAMSNVYDKKRAELYDIAVRNYFDYNRSASELNIFLKKFGCNRILELGVGTGNMVSLVAKDNDFVGIDSSQEMLNIAEKKIIFAGLENNVVLLNEDAENFSSKKRFDLIYSHSGPITSYRKDDEIFFIADSKESLISILANTKKNLFNRGLFLVNIEEPASRIYSTFCNEQYVKKVLSFDNEFHRKYTYFIDGKKVDEFELKSPVFHESEFKGVMQGLEFHKAVTDYSFDWYSMMKCK